MKYVQSASFKIINFYVQKSNKEKEEKDVQNAVAESLNDAELDTAIQESVNDIVHVEKSVVDSVIQQSQADYFGQLAAPIKVLMNAGYPLDRVTEAHAMVTSIMGFDLDDDSMIKMMTNYLLEGDIFS